MAFGDRFKTLYGFPLTPDEDARQTTEFLKMIGDKLNITENQEQTSSYFNGGIAGLKK